MPEKKQDLFRVLFSIQMLQYLGCLLSGDCLCFGCILNFRFFYDWFYVNLFFNLFYYLPSVRLSRLSIGLSSTFFVFLYLASF